MLLESYKRVKIPASPKRIKLLENGFPITFFSKIVPETSELYQYIARTRIKISENGFPIIFFSKTVSETP